MMPEEETCFCCLRISQQKRRAEDIWLEAGTTAWVRSSRGVSRCCTDKKVHQVCWLPGSDHSMASNLIKFFYCKYGGLSDSLPRLLVSSERDGEPSPVSSSPVSSGNSIFGIFRSEILCRKKVQKRKNLQYTYKRRYFQKPRDN